MNEEKRYCENCGDELIDPSDDQKFCPPKKKNCRVLNAQKRARRAIALLATWGTITRKDANKLMKRYGLKTITAAFNQLGWVWSVEKQDWLQDD